jgi:hypothetical protein
MANIPAGFPLSNVPSWTDSQGRPVRAFYYLILALWQRTGGASGNTGSTSVVTSLSPAFLGDDGGDAGEYFAIQGPPGLPGVPGSAGPAVLIDAPEADEPIMRAGLLAPGGWFDEKGSGGTPGFAAGVDFTAGTTTVLTLSQAYGWTANLIVTFDGAFQGPDQYSLNGKTLTFTSAIPNGTNKVFVKGFLAPQ